MCGSCYSAVYAEAVFHWMERNVCHETPHVGYCRYTWSKRSLFDYLAHGNYHAQSAPP